MGSKKHPQPAAQAANTEQPGGPPWVLIGGVLALAAAAVFMLYPSPAAETPGALAGAHGLAPDAADAAEPHGAAPAAAAPAPAEVVEVIKPDPDAPLPPRPFIPNSMPRQVNVIAEAYEFAGRNPDILEFVPCFCGCETAGHRANAHCFVESRNDDGTVASWEHHGMGCAVCIDVARDSMQLHASGATVRDVRAAVESKYASRFPRMTPTPEPPRPQ